MRAFWIALVFCLAIGLAACTRSDRDRRQSQAARQAGRDAYRASQAAKRGARDAERELQSAGKEFRQGWNEAKRQREDTTTRKK